MAKVEILFKAPGLSGNGMQCTEEGIWTIDNRGQPHRHAGTLQGVSVELRRQADSRNRRRKAPARAASGSTKTRTIWIASTYSREIIAADAKTGETVVKHFTPGAGVIYRRTTDIAARPDTYGQTGAARRRRSARGRGGRRGGGGGGGGGRGPGRRQGARTGHVRWVGRRTRRSRGRQSRSACAGTGAHGQQMQNGKLWVAVPPGRMIYRIDPKTWTVEHMFPTIGFRPHGIGIETRMRKHLWESDTNMGAFIKRDMVTGEIVDAIVLPDGSPFPHGASV